jgi:hypothetical protein
MEEKSENDFEKIAHSAVPLELTLPSSHISFFFPILQKGFLVKARVGINLRNLLCDDFGLRPEFVKERVKTIFLDGKPVDDLEGTIARSGATLALSGALPGLAGAVLRSGSPLAAFRSPGGTRDSLPALQGTGLVAVKIFNLLLEDLGPLFLSRGIWISRQNLPGLWESLSEKFWEGCRGAKIKGEARSIEVVRRGDWVHQADWIILSVHWLP